ncbi:MAG TPA: hypothetical protein VJ673_11465 [Aromatoleum sp.]|uniref:hypothetical protein n=1 Tax=Aromatoleum sp. TaxID=2307007 RepID=UPI002B47A6A7|nr:hypothetical protein [Aromatoleum sp.]HJV26300.1 hypothetical protein [Aromatoleum sp.]
MTSNAEFLKQISARAPAGALVGIASFAESPKTAPPGVWFTKPWARGTVPAIPAEANNYFTISCYQPDFEGRFRRKTDNFACLLAVMLDDVGTKASVPESAPLLSWLLETSPGNFQGGLLLDQPITDAAEAARLMNAFIRKGLCDPGASGPTARYARLPRGFNSKHNPPFPCRLHEWNPDRRYSPAALVEGFGLELAPKVERPKAKYKAPVLSPSAQVERFGNGLRMIGAESYGPWMIGLAALKGAVALGQLADEDGAALWWTFTDSASAEARAGNDDTRFDPEAVWGRWVPSAAPAEALVAKLFACARDAAKALVHAEMTQQGELSERGLVAARYLARYHRRVFDELGRAVA